MSIPTPGDLASADTARRTHLVHRLTIERKNAAEEHDAAKHAAHMARRHTTLTGNTLTMLLRSDEYMPPSRRRAAGIRGRASYRQEATQDKRAAEALHAATGAVLRAAEVTLWNANAAGLASIRPLPEGIRADPIDRTVYPTALAAFEFTAVDRRRSEHATSGWRSTAPGPWNREFAAQVIYNWAKTDGAWILADGAGTVFIATPERVIELSPVRRAPTEGDVLDAALRVYGLTSYLDGVDGVTYRVVSTEAGTDEEDIYTRPYLMLYAGELATRPVREHTEPWSVHLHDETGEYQDQVYAAPADLGCAEQSAATARTVAAWLTARADASPTAGAVLRSALAERGIDVIEDVAAFMVPLDSRDLTTGVLSGQYIAIADGDPSVSNPADTHTGWIAALHDLDGEPIRTLYDAMSAGPVACAADSAAAAAAVELFLSTAGAPRT
ncbi:hypothetical protein ACIQ9R_36235 [Streptomyces sp. NPDC094447]|uniref:hypothetical protein n=1 Tax=Streptomyces sp. NPDC094447 TaxID=3366062 RepID=UPI00381218DD